MDKTVINEKEDLSNTTIKLTDRERRELDGLKAQEREIQILSQPFQNNLKGFLEDLQRSHEGVLINITHTLDADKCELIPKPKEVAPEDKFEIAQQVN